MQTGFRQSTGRLISLGRQLARAGTDVPAVASRAAEREIMPLVQEGYNTRTDPMARGWLKPKAGDLPMERSGRLRRSYEVIRTTQGGRWAIFLVNAARSRGGAFYGALLQRGFTSRGGTAVAPRKQVPERVLTPRWDARLRQSIRRALVRWAGGLP